MSKKNIPVLILAGGLGTRLSEETYLKPKPMIEIGEIPILVHIMRWYYSFGFNDFVVCAGYRSWEIKSYFLTYEFRTNHLLVDHRESLNRPSFAYGTNLAQERWRVRVIDTGIDCMTGGRVARALDSITNADDSEDFQEFALTYGDGVSDVNLEEELKFHQSHRRIGTVLGVKPSARFGELSLTQAGLVETFLEKPSSNQGFINGGFFLFQKSFRDYLSTDPDCVLEREPLSRLATDSQMMCFQHPGFWQPMDTLRDKTFLQDLWERGKAPWFPVSSPGAESSKVT